MKNLYMVLAGFIALFGRSFEGVAQNTLYFANGNSVGNAEITEITDDNIKFTVRRGEREAPYSFRRENVLMVFRPDGNYLILSQISGDANAQLKAFSDLPAQNLVSDIIVKAVPPQAFNGNIVYESDEVVNYQTTNGEAAAINKNEIAAIIYKNGSHKILKDAAEAAPLLASVSLQMQPGPETGISSAATSEPIPTSEPAPVPLDGPAPTTSLSSKPVLNETDYEHYQQKALKKVDEFGLYLDMIADKKLSNDEKDKAIEQAVRLFMPTATIEVSSKGKDGARKYKIKDYLTRLKLLPYGAVNVEWSEIQYINDLKQEADGNYYGTISGQQTFTGYSKNGQDILYSDVTQKSVRVKLQSYQKIVSGQEDVNWEILLGNIGVANTR